MKVGTVIQTDFLEKTQKKIQKEEKKLKTSFLFSLFFLFGILLVFGGVGEIQFGSMLIGTAISTSGLVLIMIPIYIFGARE